MQIIIDIIILLVGILALCGLILWFYFQKDKLESALGLLYKSKMKQLDDQYENKKKLYDLEVENIKRELQTFSDRASDVLHQGQEMEANLNAKIAQKQHDFDAILRVLQADEQEKNGGLLLFNDNVKSDITYIMNEVMPHLFNKEIAAKVLWDTFVSDAAKAMFTLSNIDDTPGIYKITNLTNNKIYIGKSVKVKSRLCEHLKGALGYTTINDQLIHKVMMQDGIWNFKFEKLCSCQKEDLNEQEKFFINFFHAQEYGYNKTVGG